MRGRYFACAGAVTQPALGAGGDYDVNTLTDERNQNAKCSLREAIINANTNNQSGSVACRGGSGADTIRFNVRGTIALSSSLESILDPAGLVITGPGAKQLTISGNDTVLVMAVDFRSSLTLENLTIANGLGGVYSAGPLTVLNCNFVDNGDFGFGGSAIDAVVDGPVRIINSTFSGNRAELGGAISNAFSTMTITNSTFFDNHAQFGGGAVHNGLNSSMSVFSSTFSGNRSDRDGGALWNDGQLTVWRSTVSDNRANRHGGGIFTGETTATPPFLGVEYSTFSKNIANRGGGIYLNGGKLIARYSTLAGNQAFLHGGGIFNGGTLNLQAAIIGNSEGGDCITAAGAFFDEGYNIDTDGTCGFTDPTSQTTDPLLDSAGLKNNGGPTKTIALLAGSPAVDLIPEEQADCPLKGGDQRGFTGLVAACDAGAFELQPQTQFTCNGLAATIVGTNVNDNLSGTQAPT